MYHCITVATSQLTLKSNLSKYLLYIHYIPLSHIILMFPYAYPIGTVARGRCRGLLNAFTHFFVFFGAH